MGGGTCRAVGSGEMRSGKHWWCATHSLSDAGAIASVLTTPLDVVKTRQQTGAGASGRSMLAVAQQVVREQGLQGLLAGGVPRVLRSAPACACVLASYEAVKAALVPTQSSS